MADLVIKDGVKETTSTTGTGTFTLSGAVVGNRSFADIGNAKLTCYTAFDPLASPPTKESGIGTYTLSGTTLSRDTVLSNSLGTTAKINFTHSPIVWCDTPAAIFQGPAFSMCATVNQSISNGVATKVTLGNIVFDPAGCCASSRFTPNVPGYYTISVAGLGDATGTASSGVFYLYKNGSVFKTFFEGGTGGGNMAVGTAVVYMNGTTDYLEFFGQVTDTSAAPYFRYISASWCCELSGSFLRAG